MIVYHYCVTMMTSMITSVITVVVVIMVMMINTNCNYSESSKIRRRICISIRGIIGHIYR